MNSTFRAHWLASSEVISQVLFTSEQPKENKLAFVGIHCIVTNKVTRWATSYSACVVYTKTIIHLSVGGWIFTSPLRGSAKIHHYSPPFRWIIVNSALLPILTFRVVACSSRNSCTLKNNYPLHVEGWLVAQKYPLLVVNYSVINRRIVQNFKTELFCTLHSKLDSAERAKIIIMLIFIMVSDG